MLQSNCMDIDNYPVIKKHLLSILGLKNSINSSVYYLFFNILLFFVFHCHIIFDNSRGIYIFVYIFTRIKHIDDTDLEDYGHCPNV